MTTDLIMFVHEQVSRDTISFSGNVNFDHDQIVDIWVYDCPASVNCTYLSDTVSLPQFDPSLGTLNSVELRVESDIDVETYYYCYWDTATTSQWWYSDVVGSVNQLQAKIYQAHNNHTTGNGYYNHVFTLDGSVGAGISSCLADFIGTGLVDVEIAGANKLCAWWNFYDHLDTDTYGTVTATLIYDYTPLITISVMIDIKPGSDPNAINPSNKGVVPVAILSTADFDATTMVDPMTVAFGPAGAMPVHEGGHIEDVNLDGTPDLMLHFSTEDTGIACGDSEAVLTGETFGGVPIEGVDTIQTVKFP